MRHTIGRERVPSTWIILRFYFTLTLRCGFIIIIIIIICLCIDTITNCGNAIDANAVH